MRHSSRRDRTPESLSSEEESWPINEDKLIKRHYKAFAKFTQELDKIKEMNTEQRTTLRST
jgi:hypothetical protein